MPLMIAGLGLPELLIIFGSIVLIFGGRKLPQLGSAIGESIKNFKKGVKEDEREKLQAKASEPNANEGSHKGNDESTS